MSHAVDSSLTTAVVTEASQESPIRPRSDREFTRKDKIVALLALLALALLLRLFFFHFSPSIYWADEIFQSQEPAHRLVYGPGIVTWEYRLGVRSWILPALIAAIMKSTAWIGPGSSGYVFGTALFFALMSLTVVWFAFSWGQTYFGFQYAALAAFSTAIWFELVNFGPRALNEVLAGNLFLPAIYLGSLPSDAKVENKCRLILIGLLLGLTACLRIQYAPAVLVAGLWIMSRNWKARLLPVGAGVVAVVAIFGIVDAVTWSFPFYSYWAYFRENIVNHKAASYGILPWYYYFGSLFVHTGPLALFALIGVRRSPILGWVSSAILLPHCMIAHKEFRYIYPVLPILLVLAAIGQIDFVAVCRAKNAVALFAAKYFSDCRRCGLALFIGARQQISALAKSQGRPSRFQSVEYRSGRLRSGDIQRQLVGYWRLYVSTPPDCDFFSSQF